jgi:predicted transcriptional regulator
MDLPIEVIEAVKPKPKARAPYAKKLTKRILHAIGNGLRTSTSIANALNLPKEKIQSNLAHMKNRGYVYSHKQTNSNEHKYHITTDKPVLGQLDLTIEKKPSKPYAKRKTLVTPLAKNLQTYVKELETKLAEKSGRLNAIELTLVEKEKEVWTLECEVFDKKAIIKYLEEKLFQLGVRV